MTESEKRIPPFGLRLPADLKERVQAAAKTANRSMNAEIIARLEDSFESDEEALSLRDTILKMDRRMADIERHLDEAATAAKPPSVAKRATRD